MQPAPSVSTNGYNNGFYNQPPAAPYPSQGGMRFDNHGFGNANDSTSFDPDERQIRALLKQNLKNFEFNGAVDFDRLYNELRMADRNQSGVLNRQQVEEVVYKVRIPIQRSLIFQILEKHCRADGKVYR
jgi:hypothetical protein